MKDRENLKWIYKITKGHKAKIFFLSINNAILALISVGVALVSKMIIDEAVQIANLEQRDNQSYNRLIIFGVVLISIMLMRVALRLFTQSMTVRVQAKLDMQMRAKLFEQILKKDYQTVGGYHSGELMNRLTSDIAIVCSGIVSVVPEMTHIFFQVTGAMAVLVIFDWKFALIFLLGGISIAVIVSLFRRRLKGLHKKVQETDGKARSYFQESIESILVVKTFGIEEEMKEKGNLLLKDNYDAKMKRRHVNILANSGFNFVFNIGFVYALIWCSLQLCQGSMTYGTLTAVLQLISQVQTPFVNATRLFPHIFGVLASAERIIEIENLKVENEEPKNIDYKQVYKMMDNITFDGITFSYDRDEVLQGGFAQINKGEFVAIRGISGIGKSTLLKMLLGVFIPQSGDIIINLENGQNISVNADTRGLFSYVPQGNYLFSGSLRENLLIVNKNATEDEIMNALQVGECIDFVKELPEGIDTVIGEKGLGLSEGQAQRMAISRAILCKAPIILLDEATSALDESTEKKVLSNIKNLKNHTCVIVTHRKAALEVCDREMYIEDKTLKCDRL